MSEIEPGKRGRRDGGGGGCAKGNGIHTRQRLRGVPENRSGLNINDGHIGENVVCFPEGEGEREGRFVGETIKVTADINHLQIGALKYSEVVRKATGVT